jgi:lysophospholipase L1-like esterase
MLRHVAHALAPSHATRIPAAAAAAAEPAGPDHAALEAKFAARGVLTIPGALTAREVRALNAAIDRDRARHPEQWGRGAVKPVGGAPHRFQSVAILKNSTDFDGVLRHPAVFPLITRLMGPDVTFDEVSVMVREGCPEPAGTPSPTGGAPIHEQLWHRDGGHTAGEFLPGHPLALRNLSLVLYLDDVDARGHAFSVVPESVAEKRAMLGEGGTPPVSSIRYDPAAPPAGAAGAVPPEEEEGVDPSLRKVLGGSAEDCVGPAGTAVLMNTGCAHAGTVRGTPRQRRTIHVYYGHDTQPPISFFTGFPHRLLQAGDESAEGREARRFFCRQGPLQRVLCVGDSVRMGYEPHVDAGLRLHGLDDSREAEFGRWATLLPQGLIQGGDTRNILAQLDEWVVQQRVDVLHLNAGLHDCSVNTAGGGSGNQVPVEEYERNLGEIVHRVRAGLPRCRIALATTNQVDAVKQRAVRADGFDAYCADGKVARGYWLRRTPEDVVAYNEAMRRVAARHPGVVLHELGDAISLDGLSEDGIHPSPEGYVQLGAAVVRALGQMNHR